MFAVRETCTVIIRMTKDAHCYGIMWKDKKRSSLFSSFILRMNFRNETIRRTRRQGLLL